MSRVRRSGMSLLAALALIASARSGVASPSASFADTPNVAADAPAGLASALAQPSFDLGAADARTLLAKKEKPASTTEPGEHVGPTLSPERAQTILRSLTVPGWGQAAMGHTTAATVFGVAEIGIWVSYLSFSVQEHMRSDAFQRTALVQAGINLQGRDEEFKRIVGSYISSDEYNELVVRRDAANQFYDTTGHLVDPIGYQNYVAEHSLKGLDTWTWPSDESLLRYRGQRKDAQRAALRSNTALGLAVVNRLISAIHAARIGPAHSSHSFELSFPDETDPTAVRVGVRTRF